MDKKELNKLIEEVLLQEFKVKLVDIDGDGKPDVNYEFPNQRTFTADDDKENSLKVFGTKSPSGGRHLALKAMDKDSATLSPEDLEAAFKLSPMVKGDNKAARSLAHSMKDSSKNEPAFRKVAQDIYSQSIQYDPDPEADERVVGKQKTVTKPKGGGISIDDREIDAFDLDMDDKETLAPGDFPGVDDLQKDTVGDDKLPNIWKDGSDLGVEIKAERSTVAVFRSIPGDSVIKKFDNLSKFALALQDQGKLDKWMENHNEFDLVNYSTVLANLGDFGKNFSGSPAGFEFEKFLAFFVNLPVVGGTGGAADNVGKLINKINGTDVVFYSAKLYNSFSPSQALGSLSPKDKDKKGIRYICETLGQPIYYIIGMKSTEDFKTLGADETRNVEGKYNHVNVFIVKIEHDKNKENDAVYKGKKIKGYTFSVLDENGKEGKVLPTFASGGKLKLMGEKAQYSQIANKPTFELPVLQISGLNPDALTIKSADYVQKKMKQFNKDVSDTIVTIYKRLKNLDFNTREYTASKGTNSGNLGGMARSATDYLKQVQVDYSALNTEYTKVFKAGGELTGGGKKQLKRESKSPLDQLIEAIVKKKLLK